MQKAYTSFNSTEYYDDYAESFIEQTQSLDMTDLHNRFLQHIKPHGWILDAGCGAGRDISAFQSKGYEVVAFDASVKMAQQASEHTGIQVTNTSFLQFSSERKFDGIWACASLLHVSESEIVETINHLVFFLKKEGAFYLSFKYGEEERLEGDRLFLDMTEARLNGLMSKLNSVKLRELWITKDVRGEARPPWLNVILYKV